MKLEVFQIDAWRNPDLTWYYNNRISIGYIEVNGMPTTRKILKALRNKEWLSGSNSYTIDEFLAYDGIYVVMQKNTLEPLFDVVEVEDENDSKTNSKV